MKKKFLRSAAAILAVAAICITSGCDAAKTSEISSGGDPAGGFDMGSVHALCEAKFPDEVTRPTDYNDPDFESKSEAYRTLRSEAAKAAEELKDGDTEFYQKLTKQLIGEKSGENAVISPVNVYLMLAMLAETTAGNSRAQLLSLLGEKDIESLRDRTDKLWTANCNMGDIRLANSIWLRNYGADFVQPTLDTLQNIHHASAYSGDTGSPEMAAKLKDWLKEATNGFLPDEAYDAPTLTADTVMEIVSAIYYKSSWSNPFEEYATRDDIFRGAKGDSTVPFMHITEHFAYLDGDGMRAVRLPLETGSMWLILPDDKTGVDDIVSSGRWTDVLFVKSGARVALSLPKFDVYYDNRELITDLKELGVTDIFDANVADFSSLRSDGTPTYVGEAGHIARLKIDEKGCEAAAFSYAGVMDAAAPIEDKPIELKLDKPFIFLLENAGRPLFVGTVCNIG